MSYAALKYDVSAPDLRAPAAAPLSVFALRRWLHGRWALLFSHADDFAAYGFESDRWLVHVQEAFAAADIRPLALADHQEASWVTEVGGGTTTLTLDEIQRYPVARDSREATLRNAAFDRSARFVMTLDAELRLRRTFVYTKSARLPSPMDLAALARGVRDAALKSRAIVPDRPASSCRR
jgi:hypothetical protein